MTKLRVVFIFCLVSSFARAVPVDYVCETYEFAVFPPTYQILVGTLSVTLDASQRDMVKTLSVAKNSSGRDLPFRLQATARAIRPQADPAAPILSISLFRGSVPAAMYLLQTFNIAERSPIHVSLMAEGGQLYYVYCDPK